METVKAYYYLAKPGIVYGNSLAALAGFLLASRGNVDVTLLLAFMIGIGLVMASACALNNYIDRGIDSKMARTKKRAVPTGRISGRNAVIYSAVLGVLGFGPLVVYTNWLTAALGAVAYFAYIVLYGIAKRTTVHSTLVGTISGAIPPAAGYVAVTGVFDVGALLLFVIMVIWQMPHFYAIGMFRRKEYATAGLPVLPVKKGMYATKIQIVAYSAAYIPAVALLTLAGYAGWTFLFAMAALGGLWLYKGVRGFAAKNDEAWARGMFGFSLYVLLTFCGLLSIDWLLP